MYFIKFIYLPLWLSKTNGNTSSAFHTAGYSHPFISPIQALITEAAKESVLQDEVISSICIYKPLTNRRSYYDLVSCSMDTLNPDRVVERALTVPVSYIPPKIK